jgi:TolB protein
MKSIFVSILCAAALLTSAPALRAGEKLVISKPYDSLGFLEPILVHITGLTGEADNVLKSDLIFMGVVHKPLAEAKYLINAGATGARAEARVLEAVTKGLMHQAAFTADSQRAAVHALADSIATKLTGLPGIAQTRMTFKVETGPARGEIYISDYDGFGAFAVTSDQTIVASPGWAGRGTLVYASYKLGNPYIFSHVLSTGNRAPVAKHAGNNYSPAVSPDGRRVAMILNKNGSPNLYVANIDGSGLLQLTHSREGDACPCWSPDGQSICYASRAGGATALRVISAGGGSPRVLRTTFAPSPTEPDWSPDGKWIAFTSLTGGFKIFIVLAAGGEAHEVAQGEDPSWAPNSRALMFCSGPDHGKHL